MNTAPNATTRLFLALWPSLAVQRQLHAAQLRWAWPPLAKPTPPDHLHLTLLFIGLVPTARVTDIARGLVVPCSDFTFELDAAEVWPNGCAVMAVRRPPLDLLELHVALTAAMHGLHLSVDTRAFRPHVTLARKAAGAMPPAPATLSWPVRSYVLVQSAQGQYTPVAHYARAAPI